jgi:hypothetical protein
MIEIQNNLPIPPRRGRPVKYPLDLMQVGDSFFVATQVRSTLSNSINRCRKKLGSSFTVRTVEENGVRGLRVWRVA